MNSLKGAGCLDSLLILAESFDTLSVFGIIIWVKLSSLGHRSGQRRTWIGQSQMVRTLRRTSIQIIVCTTWSSSLSGSPLRSLKLSDASGKSFCDLVVIKCCQDFE